MQRSRYQPASRIRTQGAAGLEQRIVADLSVDRCRKERPRRDASRCSEPNACGLPGLRGGDALAGGVASGDLTLGNPKYDEGRSREESPIAKSPKESMNKSEKSCDRGSEPRAEPCTDPCGEPGCEPCSESGVSRATNPLPHALETLALVEAAEWKFQPFSAPVSQQGSERGSAQGSQAGSAQGSQPGSPPRSQPGSALGSAQGSERAPSLQSEAGLSGKVPGRPVSAGRCGRWRGRP
jgi:hypothetical protein